MSGFTVKVGADNRFAYQLYLGGRLDALLVARGLNPTTYNRVEAQAASIAAAENHNWNLSATKDTQRTKKDEG